MLLEDKGVTTAQGTNSVLTHSKWGCADMCMSVCVQRERGCGEFETSLFGGIAMGTEWHSACSCTEELFEGLGTGTITRVDKNVYVCDQQVALLVLSLCREHVATLEVSTS
jgi:hypothetical protein